MLLSINFLLLYGFLPSAFCGKGYYWRDWNGTVPSDAFVAANDSRGPVYFAQAYVYGVGIFVGNIEKNQHSMAVNLTTGTGPVRYSNILKIFCSSPNAVLWLPATSTLIPRLTRFVQPVIGGIMRNNGTVLVGKLDYEGRTYVGSIHSDNYLYYTKASGEGAYNSKYELLVHEIGKSQDGYVWPSGIRSCPSKVSEKIASTTDTTSTSTRTTPTTSNTTPTIISTTPTTTTPATTTPTTITPTTITPTTTTPTTTTPTTTTPTTITPTTTTPTTTTSTTPTSITTTPTTTTPTTTPPITTTPTTSTSTTTTSITTTPTTPTTTTTESEPEVEPV